MEPIVIGGTYRNVLFGFYDTVDGLTYYEMTNRIDVNVIMQSGRVETLEKFQIEYQLVKNWVMA